MYYNKIALILTSLAINASHAALEVRNNEVGKTDPTPYQAYHNMSEEETVSLINGLYRESHEVTAKPTVASVQNVPTTIPSELIALIKEMVFGAFFYKKSGEEDGFICFIKFLGDYLITGTYDRNIIIYDINSQSQKTKKMIPIQEGILRFAIMDSHLLFLGLQSSNGAIIKVFDTKNDFAEFVTLKLTDPMALPCAQFDPLKKILFSISYKKIYLHSIANFKETKKLGKAVLEIRGRARYEYIELTDQFIMTGDSYGRIQLHRREKPYTSSTLATHRNGGVSVNSLAHSKRFNLLFCSWGNKNEVAVFNTETAKLVTCIGKSEIDHDRAKNIYYFSSPSCGLLLSEAVSHLIFDDKKGHLFVGRCNNTLDIYDGNHFQSCQGKENEINPIFTMNPLSSSSFCYFSISPSRQMLAYSTENKADKEKDIWRLILYLSDVYP